jgi:hypothetical protein
MCVESGSERVKTASKQTLNIHKQIMVCSFYEMFSFYLKHFFVCCPPRQGFCEGLLHQDLR